LGGALDVSASLHDRVEDNGCFWVGDVTLGRFTATLTVRCPNALSELNDSGFMPS